MMIANLPLLFANGNPIALSEITIRQLEKFISFMVTCSWGHDTAKEIRQPPWWPDDVAFAHPFQAPPDCPRDWGLRLTQLVTKCYDYHKSAFLLVFSAQLARYPRKRLRYVDNRDHTTSLYYIPTGRLLVTFRNENLYYDRKIIPISSRPIRPEPEIKSNDIYLCDYCDSHFDNLDILRTHERLCNQEPVSTVASGGLEEFIGALKLKPAGENTESTQLVATKRPRTIRAATNVDRGTNYPFSSAAYLKTFKPTANVDPSFNRDRIERYCSTVLNHKPSGSKNKHAFPVRYKRPVDYWNRQHVFPNQRNKMILTLKSQLLYLKCRPLQVNVHSMSLEEIDEAKKKVKEEAQKAAAEKNIEFVDGFDNDVIHIADSAMDPLKREHKMCDEIIDLCSDDDDNTNENLDPRAGVACVMRGGAVLRRTASTPIALPNEPCGARQKHTMLLKSHPVFIFTPSLVNVQSISID